MVAARHTVHPSQLMRTSQLSRVCLLQAPVQLDGGGPEGCHSPSLVRHCQGERSDVTYSVPLQSALHSYASVSRRV